MADRTLPNGRKVLGLPDDMTFEQIKEWAIRTGAASEEDYNNFDRKTKADYASLGGSIAGGVAGSMVGAFYGSAIPIVGTAIGGLIGGALGTAAGYFGGEAAESYVEDRDFDVEKATEEAVKEGVTDAVFSAGFGVIGKTLKTVYQPIRGLFKPKYFATSADSAAADVAMAIQRGETTLAEVVARGDFTEGYIKEVQEQLAKRGEELDIAENLQRKLTDVGASMMPSQAAKEYGTYAQDYASSSIFLKSLYDDALAKQDTFILKQFQDILGDTTANKTRLEVGEALQALVKDSDLALQKVVEPLYKTIDKEGAIHLATGRIKNSVQRTFDALPNPSKNARTILDTVSKINAKLSPAEVYQQMGALRKLRKSISPSDAGARKVLDSAMKNLEGTLKNNKRFVRPDSAIAVGKDALNSLINKAGDTGLVGAHKKVAQKLANMRPHMSFSEAHRELSELKRLMRDAKASVGSKSSGAEALLNKSIDALDESMTAAAKRFNPALKETYDGLKKTYNDGINTIHGDWISKALRTDNVADIGQYLVKAGEDLSVDSVKKLIAKAKELKVDVKGNNILESMEKEFINNLFPTGSMRSGLQFMDKMQSAKFADTFHAIVGKEKAEKLLTLGKEIQMLSRGVEGAEAALSLSVRGAELGAIRSAAGGEKWKTLIYPLVGMIAKGQLKGKKITAKINALKAANKSMRDGKPVPKKVIDKIMEGLPTSAAYTGSVVGKLTLPEDSLF